MEKGTERINFVMSESGAKADDSLRPLFFGLGIDVTAQYTTPRGRPYKVVDGGKPIAELVG